MTKFFLQLPPNPPHTDGSIKYSKLTAKSQGIAAIPSKAWCNLVDFSAASGAIMHRHDKQKSNAPHGIPDKVS